MLLERAPEVSQDGMHTIEVTPTVGEAVECSEASQRRRFHTGPGSGDGELGGRGNVSDVWGVVSQLVAEPPTKYGRRHVGSAAQAVLVLTVHGERQVEEPATRERILQVVAGCSGQSPHDRYDAGGAAAESDLAVAVAAVRLNGQVPGRRLNESMGTPVNSGHQQTSTRGEFPRGTKGGIHTEVWGGEPPPLGARRAEALDAAVHRHHQGTISVKHRVLADHEQFARCIDAHFIHGPGPSAALA
ncbi:hypothetical protein OG435_49380 [Streptomyces sp. NBC_01264]|nr:hypothetical protein [Streptomyces sp. NBC_01264]MCX4784541.1 hypothetical protein [Streptomyces sp. NBC_01264]